MLENEMFPSGNDYHQHQERISAGQSKITNYAEYLQDMVLLACKSAEMNNWKGFLKEADGLTLTFNSRLSEVYAHIHTDFDS